MTEITALLLDAWRSLYGWAGAQPVFLQIIVAWAGIELLRGLWQVPVATLRAYHRRRQYRASFKKAVGLSERRSGGNGPARAGDRAWIG